MSYYFLYCYSPYDRVTVFPFPVIFIIHTSTWGPFLVGLLQTHDFVLEPIPHSVVVQMDSKPYVEVLIPSKPLITV